MLQQTLAVFLVLALLLAALWLLKRKGIAAVQLGTGWGARLRLAGGERHMRVVERIILTPQHSLHLVSIENKLVVFAASPGGCQAVDHAVWAPADCQAARLHTLEKTVASC